MLIQQVKPRGEFPVPLCRVLVQFSANHRLQGKKTKRGKVSSCVSEVTSCNSFTFSSKRRLVASPAAERHVFLSQLETACVTTGRSSSLSGPPSAEVPAASPRCPCAASEGGAVCGAPRRLRPGSLGVRLLPRRLQDAVPAESDGVQLGPTRAPAPWRRGEFLPPAQRFWIVGFGKTLLYFDV